jgi:hypothetical protein
MRCLLHLVINTGGNVWSAPLTAQHLLGPNGIYEVAYIPLYREWYLKNESILCEHRSNPNRFVEGFKKL